MMAMIILINVVVMIIIVKLTMIRMVVIAVVVPTIHIMKTRRVLGKEEPDMSVFCSQGVAEKLAWKLFTVE